MRMWVQHERCMVSFDGNSSLFPFFLFPNPAEMKKKREDASAASPIRVPHLRRQASSRLHALFPAKHGTSPGATEDTAPVGHLSLLACRAALTSWQRPFHNGLRLSSRKTSWRSFPTAIGPVCIDALVAVHARRAWLHVLPALHACLPKHKGLCLWPCVSSGHMLSGPLCLVQAFLPALGSLDDNWIFTHQHTFEHLLGQYRPH